ncbi:hypothetical protein ECG_02286 [Echinococcus granulosus]|uniref:Uncharacterized protein n=1 Tax=Echinococcus granulosus TaxID=6210 RepID=A0A068WRQ0_ECHGR|nr:hypothetical protein ECG_02286 [Echinococcus granulosus]CDS20331.1 hypothetical protein EgrG_000255000 [Echinococcus granulosus]
MSSCGCASRNRLKVKSRQFLSLLTQYNHACLPACQPASPSYASESDDMGKSAGSDSRVGRPYCGCCKDIGEENLVDILETRSFHLSKDHKGFPVNFGAKLRIQDFMTLCYALIV